MEGSHFLNLGGNFNDYSKLTVYDLLLYFLVNDKRSGVLKEKGHNKRKTRLSLFSCTILSFLIILSFNLKFAAIFGNLHLGTSISIVI